MKTKELATAAIKADNITLEEATRIATGVARSLIATSRRNEPRPDKRSPGTVKANHNETVLEALFVRALSNVVTEGRKAERRRILGLLAGLSDMWRKRYKQPDIDPKSALLADVRADALEILVAVITAQAMSPETAIPIGPLEAQEILRRSRGDRVAIEAPLREQLTKQLDAFFGNVLLQRGDEFSLRMTFEEAERLRAALKELEPRPTALDRIEGDDAARDAIEGLETANEGGGNGKGIETETDDRHG
jgi:hypothetical protein